MKHVGRITKESMPQLAVPGVSTKEGCKANLSGGEVLVCKSVVKRDGFYPFNP